MSPSRASLLVATALAFALAGAASPAAADDGAALVAAASSAFETASVRLQAGQASVDEVYTWSVRWLDAQRDAPLKGRALADAAAAHLERMKALEQRVTAQIDAGGASATIKPALRYYVVQAERWVKRKGKR